MKEMKLKGTLSLISLVFLIFLLSCNNKKEEKYFYETGELYVSKITNSKNYTQKGTLYYKNGNKITKFNSYVYENSKQNSCFGKFQSFYPDGFPKEDTELSNKGESIKPTKEEALKGFETNFDYISFGAEDTLGNKYTVFRYFIKGVPLFYQDVFICSPDSLLIHAYKLDPDMHTYKIIKKDTFFNVDIDENLYSYYVPIDERHMKPIGDGKYELKVGVFFKNLGNDEDLPSPHVSFTVFVDPDEEFF